MTASRRTVLAHLARYLLRPPVSLERLKVDERTLRRGGRRPAGRPDIEGVATKLRPVIHDQGRRHPTREQPLVQLHRLAGWHGGGAGHLVGLAVPVKTLVRRVRSAGPKRPTTTERDAEFGFDPRADWMGFPG